MFYWTASFQAIVNFIELRDEPTAQWEIREYAKVLKKLLFGNCTQKLPPFGRKFIGKINEKKP